MERGEAIGDSIESDIPARMDRLPWSRWHTRVIVALGVTWLLDGLEGSLGGSLAGALKQGSGRGGLGFTDAGLGLSSELLKVSLLVTGTPKRGTP